ncbi:MAG: 30S ribosomal protein S8 [Candidatus Nealsonbacteria bacterium]|nr:30S ribosomal protein S8 [Candidatus Nealsonbacteria bacterium]
MDPVADMLTKIRNAQIVLHPMVSVSYSDLKYEVVKIFEKYGFIERIEKKGRKVKKTIDIYLKYQDKASVISGLKKISKPGQRIYSGFQTMFKIKKNSGILIVSTPKGLMSDVEARKQKLGGEIICEIW